MKRIMVIMALCLGLLIPTMAFVVALSTPVEAGQDYWSTSDCRPEVWWLNYTGTYGTRYYWSSQSGVRYDEWVDGARMNLYSQLGYQCGVLGPPTSHWDGWTQWFENGYMWKDYQTGCLRYHFGYDYYSVCVG